MTDAPRELYRGPCCDRCTFEIRGRDPIYAPTDSARYCARCFPQSRFRRVTLIARTCGACGRLMQLGESLRIRHCSGTCRARAFGLGAAQR